MFNPLFATLHNQDGLVGLKLELRYTNHQTTLPVCKGLEEKYQLANPTPLHRYFVVAEYLTINFLSQSLLFI